uniref:Uncharacterized protein n=1 Tax=Branchiostoma floridae TaxID=7739 RepID=C3Y889_BRAFL|eukprot:XP_002607548.1 hypothetical protein BRAFLDRAFT_106497 [Branchiostoma floridae]
MEYDGIRMSSEEICQAERLAAFRRFRDVVVRHIPHQYSSEMEQPLEQPWLGLQFKNDNKSRDMADIHRTIQTNYVPSEVDEDGITHLVQPILLGGDWLLEERAEGNKPALGAVIHP